MASITHLEDQDIVHEPLGIFRPFICVTGRIICEDCGYFANR